MIRQLLYKWFGLSDPPCLTCEVLREQLAKSDADRRDLLHRLLEKDKPEPPVAPSVDAPVPVGNQYIPWRVRQQMLEQEDRKAAHLMKQRTEEIGKLESELGIPSSRIDTGIKLEYPNAR